MENYPQLAYSPLCRKKYNSTKYKVIPLILFCQFLSRPEWGRKKRLSSYEILAVTLDGENGLARNHGASLKRWRIGLILMRTWDPCGPGAKASDGASRGGLCCWPSLWGAAATCSISLCPHSHLCAPKLILNAFWRLCFRSVIVTSPSGREGSQPRSGRAVRRAGLRRGRCSGPEPSGRGLQGRPCPAPRRWGGCEEVKERS